MRSIFDARTRVILVEDDVAQANATRRALLAIDALEVEIFHTATEARDALTERPFDVILSDFDLGDPSLSGVEVLDAAARACPDAPRVLVTARTEWSTATRSINEARVFRVLAKPWDEDVLVTTLNEAIELKRARDLKREVRVIAKRHQMEIAGANARLLSQNLLLSRVADEREHGLLGAIAAAADVRAGARPSARSLAQMARIVAFKLGSGADQAQAVELGVLMHRFGTIAAREINDRAAVAMAGASIARAAKMSEEIARVVEDQYETFDGRGMPQGLAGKRIALGARILAVVTRYANATATAAAGDPIAHARACTLLRCDASLDPEIVEVICREPVETWTCSDPALETMITGLLEAAAQAD